VWFLRAAETVRGLESKLDAARHQLMKLLHQPSASHAVSATSSSSSLKDANFDGINNISYLQRMAR